MSFWYFYAIIFVSMVWNCYLPAPVMPNAVSAQRCNINMAELGRPIGGLAGPYCVLPGEFTRTRIGRSHS